MTFQEALKTGYRVVDYSLQRGYVSVKTDPLNQQVLTAGGRRKGQKYYLAHCAYSTKYCMRIYLEKVEASTQ